MVLLRCVDAREAEKMLVEVHEGSFGTHAMAQKILRAGYYWLSMESDCCTLIDYVRYIIDYLFFMKPTLLRKKLFYDDPFTHLTTVFNHRRIQNVAPFMTTILQLS